MSLYQIIQNWVTHWVLRKPVGGLYEEVDPRNFGAHVIAGEVTEEDLIEEEFSNIEIKELIHQKSTDFCVGCTKAYGKLHSEGVKMSWAGAFAMGCRARGWFTGWGISVLQVMRGAVKYGVPDERMWPYTGNRNYSANWRNMPQRVLNNAMKHRDESFFQIYGIAEMDRFDQFRAYLNKFRDRGVIIQTGIDAHSVTLIGQKYHNGELCLYGPDSYGGWNHNYRRGKCVDGYRYFNRDDSRYLFVGYMSFDMKRDLAELLNTYDGKAVKTEGGKECYLVSGGKRRHLRNEAIAWSHNTLLFGEDNVFVLSMEELTAIPTGTDAEFDEGANRDVVLRILAKVGRTDMIND